MRIDVDGQSKTKLCPFCAEVIQAEAMKCRFCNEILIPERIKAVEMAIGRSPESGENKKGEVLFSASPSLWALGSWLIKGFLALVAGGLLLFYPIENLGSKQPVNPDSSQSYLINPGSITGYGQLPDSQESSESIPGSFQRFIRKFRTITGLGLIITVSFILLTKAAKLKAIRYDITSERIEWTRGLLAKKVDNIDMFRIIDMRFYSSFLDRLIGIGAVTLITTDKTDPDFHFEKVHNARQLYDIVKKASLDADRRTNVVHLE